MAVSVMTNAAWTWLTEVVDYGSVPDWLAGVGAVTALLWARKAARAAAETNKMQNTQIKTLEKRQHLQDVDQYEAQARLIVIWLSYTMEDDYVSVQLTNASMLPVGQVVVTIARPEIGELREFEAPFLPAVPSFEIELLSDTFNRIVMIEPPVFIRDYPAEILSVAFTDVNGVRWTRNLRGQLTETLPELRD